jgi:hypothetical protein
MAQENAAFSYPLPNPAQNSSKTLSIEEQVVRLINRDFVATTSCVKELHNWLDEQRKYKSFGLVTEPQGVGKSVALKSYLRLNGDRALRSIPLYTLYLEVLPTWGIRDICIRILELLNHGDRKGRNKNLLLRTWETLKEFGVEVLIVDHADTLTRQALLSLIRLSLRKQTRISLVLAGSTELESKLIKQDLDGYFESSHSFGGLSLDEFSDVLLDHFGENFLGLSDPLVMFDDQIMNDLYVASENRDINQCVFYHFINVLTKVIVQSSEDQISLCINKAVLQQVISNYRKRDKPLPNLPGDA